MHELTSCVDKLERPPGNIWYGNSNFDRATLSAVEALNVSIVFDLDLDDDIVILCINIKKYIVCKCVITDNIYV